MIFTYTLPIIATVSSLIAVNHEVYMIQHDIKSVRDGQHVCDFLCVHRFPSPVNLTVAV